MNKNKLDKKNRTLVFVRSSLKKIIASGKAILSGSNIHTLKGEAFLGFIDSRHSCSQARMPFLFKELLNC